MLLTSISVTDFKAIAIIAGATYSAVTQSSTVYLFLTCFLVAAAIKLLLLILYWIGWNQTLASVIALTVSSILSIEVPANAQFFDALEQE